MASTRNQTLGSKIRWSSKGLISSTTANVGSSAHVRMKSSIAELSLSKPCVGLGGGGEFCVNGFIEQMWLIALSFNIRNSGLSFFHWINGRSTRGSSTAVATIQKIFLQSVKSVQLSHSVWHCHFMTWYSHPDFCLSP